MCDNIAFVVQHMFKIVSLLVPQETCLTKMIAC